MNQLSDFFITFCVSAIFIGSLLIICPNGQISKSVKYILSIVFILIVISSAFKIDFNFDFNIDSAKTTATVEELEIKSAHYVYSTCLTNAEIDFSKITILTNKTNDDRIIISKVVIFSKEDKNKILSALSVVAQNIEVEIINE